MGVAKAPVCNFIDEFKIYPYERTSAQLQTDAGQVSSLHGASASFGGDDSYLSDGLVGYWTMDESSWTNDPAYGGRKSTSMQQPSSAQHLSPSSDA